MSTTTLSARILTGHDRARYGIESRIVVVAPSQARDSASPNRARVSDGDVFLSAPLFSVQDNGSYALILVGRCHIVVPAEQPPHVTVIVEALWKATDPAPRASGADAAARGWHSAVDHPHLEAAVAAALGRPGHLDPQEPMWRAVTIAKAVSEHTRQAVAELRAIRYAAERQFGERLRGRADDQDHLGDLVELSIAASRARDISREAEREGLWLWRTDKDAYHAHRRQLDPTLPMRESSSRDLSQPWLPTLDAGVRQCREAVNQLEEEIDQFHRLLEAASTISVARDARAQEQFNFVATVGAVTLGLPALALGVYGAGAEPDFQHWPWLLPFGVSGVFSIGIAMWLSGAKRLRGGALTLVAVTLTLLTAQIAVWVAA